MNSRGHHRPVRSFVRREGRMTPAQRRALEALWPRYGVEPPARPLDPAAVFGRHAPLALEIGFGDGAVLAAMAAARPDWDFLGVEVHRPGVGRLLARLEREGLQNVRVACADAVEVLRDWLPDGALAAVYIFFPDPWPKKRHRKRRLVQPAFGGLLVRKLAPGARLHLATDWEDYAAHMRAVLEATAGLRNLAGAGAWAERPAERPPTKYETRGRRLGHRVFDLAYVRT